MTRSSNILSKVVLFFIPLSFIDFFKLEGIPLTLIFIISGLFVFKFKLMKINSGQYKYNASFYYLLFFLSSLPIAFYSLNLASDSLKTFIYSCIPALYMFCYPEFEKFYSKNKKYLFFGILLVTAIGWIFYLRILDPTVLFLDAKLAEVDLNYWGIRYMMSSRNADYIYPLIGALISLEIFKNKFLKYIFFIAFLMTLVLSLSRGALLIFIVIIFFHLYSILKHKNKLFTLIFSVIIPCVILYSQDFIDFNIYFDIFSSIFSSTNVDFSNFDRISVLNSTFDSFTSNPFGAGIDNFNLKGFDTKSAENAYLTILLERGLFPFIFFMLFTYMCLASSLTNNNNSYIWAFTLLLYFLFNYELNNIFGNFLLLFMVYETRKKVNV